MRKGLDKNFTIFIAAIILTVMVSIILFVFSSGVLLKSTPVFLENMKELFAWID